MKKIPFFALLFLLSLVTGCSKPDVQGMLKKMVPAESDQLAEKFTALLREGDFEALKSLEAPEMREAPQAEIEKIRGYLDRGKVLSKKFVGYQWQSMNGIKSENISYELECENGWVLISVLVAEKDNQKQIAGFHVNQMPKSLEEHYAFTLSGKSFLHYLMLAWAVLGHLLVLLALIVCLRTKLEKKWIWMLAILFGNLSTQYNWTDGFSPENMRITAGFNFGAFRAGVYGPWLLTLMIPIGAIVFFCRKKPLSNSQDSGPS